VKIRWICDVSLWEIAIKQKNGKLSDAVLVKVYEAIRDGLIKPISLSRGSLEAYCALDFDSDHKDPFDRLIISTAHVHDLPIVTTDARILAYQNRWNLSIMN
jgi:PIN domain nuclease of toxin-antitoxin system